MFLISVQVQEVNVGGECGSVYFMYGGVYLFQLLLLIDYLFVCVGYY